jgi:hypothetical protein
MSATNLGGALWPHPPIRTANVGDEMHPKTTTTQAQIGVMKTGRVLAETAHVVDPLAAHVKGLAAEATMIGPDASAENDPVQLAKTVADTGTAATDTVIRALKMKDGRLEGIVTRDRALARHGNHAALHGH